MYPRDLFVGLLLFGGAGWIVSGEPVGSGGIAVGVAIIGCFLAGGVYLCSAVGLGVDREIGGARLSRLRLRVVAQVAIGGSLIVLGADGSLSSGTGSPLLLPAAIAVVGLGVLLWTRRAGASSSDGPHGQNGSNASSSPEGSNALNSSDGPDGSNTTNDAHPDRDHT